MGGEAPRRQGLAEDEAAEEDRPHRHGEGEEGTAAGPEISDAIGAEDAPHRDLEKGDDGEGGPQVARHPKRQTRQAGDPGAK